MKKVKVFLSLMMVIMFGLSAYTMQISASENDDPGIQVDATASSTVVAGSDDMYSLDLSIVGGKTSENGVTYEPIDVVLLLDTSYSMHGEPFTTAKESAKQFAMELLAHSNRNIRVSVIGFGGGMTIPGTTGTYPNAITYVELSSDSNQVAQAIDNITITGAQTAMKDGIEAAKTQFDSYGNASAMQYLVLLGDGAPQDYSYSNDVTYRDSCYASMQALVTNNPNVHITSIGYRLDKVTQEARDVLYSISQMSTSGQFYDASVDNLSSVFDGIYVDIYTFIEKLDIEVQIPEGFTYVPNSLTTTSNVTVDDSLAAQSRILKIHTGKMSELDHIDLSFKVQIEQNTNKKVGNTLVYNFDYDYKTATSVKQASTTSSVDLPIYEVATNSGEHGRVSTSRLVGKGASYQVAWEADEGYQVSKLLVNNQSVNVADKQTSYTIENITDNQNVQVSFAKVPIEKPVTPTPKPTPTPTPNEKPSVAVDKKDNIIVSVEGVNGSVKTADTSNGLFYMGLLVISGAVIFYTRRKVRTQK